MDRKKKADLVLKALEGKYTDGGLFALKQAYDGYKFCLQQIDECDSKINVVINRLGESGEGQDLKKNVKQYVTTNRRLKGLGQTY